MGLLDSIFNTPEGRMGLGLLALGQMPKSQGMPGLMGLFAAQDAAAQNKGENAWREESRGRQKKEWDQQDRESALAGQFFRPATQGLSPLVGDAKSGILPSAGRPGAPASFDMQGYAQAMMQVNPAKGMEIMQALQKELPVDKLKPEQFTPASLAKFAQSRNYGDLVPRDKMEVSEGVVYNPYDSTMAGRTLPNPNKPFQLGADGSIVPNRAYQQYELSKASAGSARTNVNVDAGPKAFWSDFGKNATDVLFKEREGAQAAASTVQSIAQIRSAVERGAYQGTGADAKLTASKALGALGMPYDAKTVANTELFNATANQFVLDKIKTLGANPSNADRDFIEKTVPRIGTDPAALPQLLDFMEQRAGQQIGTFNQKIKSVQGQQGAQFLPFSLEVPAPQARAQPQQQGKSSPPGGASGGWDEKPIPAAAVNDLKMRGPKAHAQFDAVFGEGAAARALGGK